eukprot:10333829-Ditylum_brightwellii.AAC.1
MRFLSSTILLAVSATAGAFTAPSRTSFVSSTSLNAFSPTSKYNAAGIRMMPEEPQPEVSQ